MGKKLTGIPIMLNLSTELNERVMKQMERLSTNKTTIIRMALTRYLEELENSEFGRDRDAKKKVPGRI